MQALRYYCIDIMHYYIQYIFAFAFISERILDFICISNRWWYFLYYYFSQLLVEYLLVVLHTSWINRKPSVICIPISFQSGLNMGRQHLDWLNIKTMCFNMVLWNISLYYLCNSCGMPCKYHHRYGLLYRLVTLSQAGSAMLDIK